MANDFRLALQGNRRDFGKQRIDASLQCKPLLFGKHAGIHIFDLNCLVRLVNAQFEQIRLDSVNEDFLNLLGLDSHCLGHLLEFECFDGFAKRFSKEGVEGKQQNLLLQNFGI